jgi:hypothetical protein
MQKNILPNLRNILTFRYEPRMSNLYQIDLQPPRKDKIMCKKRSMDNILLIFPFLFLFYPRSAQPKDTPLRLLALIQTYMPLIGSRQGSTKVPCRRIPLHALISIAHSSFYSSSTFNINPL